LPISFLVPQRIKWHLSTVSLTVFCWSWCQLNTGTIPLNDTKVWTENDQTLSFSFSLVAILSQTLSLSFSPSLTLSPSYSYPLSLSLSLTLHLLFIVSLFLSLSLSYTHKHTHTSHYLSYSLMHSLSLFLSPLLFLTLLDSTTDSLSY